MTSTEPADPSIAADIQKIDNLKAEVNALKQEAATKNAEIAAIEKDLGVTAWDRLSEKIKPMRDAISSAAAKAKPVVLNAADKVQEKANSLLGRKKEDEEEAPFTDPAPGTEDTAQQRKSSATSTPTSSSPGTPKNGESKPEDNLALTPEQAEAHAKIERLKEEVSDIQRRISNKESEIVWLEKKAGLSGGPLKKIGTAMEPHLNHMKHNLSVAKVKTGEQLTKAKTRGKELWKNLAQSAGKLKTSMSEKMNSSKEAGSSSSSGGSSKAAASSGNEDMYQRYA